MADALVSELLKQLVSIIRQQAEQEVRLVVGVKKEVDKLTSNLQTIQAVLEDAERRQVKEATVKQWLAKLKDVSYDMDDVLDEWNTAILKIQIEGDENAPQPKKVCPFIPSCFCCRQVGLRRDIAIKIKELNKRLDVIAHENHNFNVTLMGSNEEPERRVTISAVDVSKVHGRDEDKNTIVSMLVSESSQAPTFRIISIVGMGGIGKTTLAQLVYNDDAVKAHFSKRIWVCVSDPFDEVRIAKAILEALSGATPNLNELESLSQKINESLERTRFLLVLDDVWTEDYQRLEQLKNSLKCGLSGSGILVTTRKETVAETIETTNMFRLGQLSNEACWSLFSQVAFFGRNKEECEKLEDIGRKIVDKCKGLPLAAKILGSLLRSKRSKERWQHVLNSDVWKLEVAENGIFPPLLLSYYDLSSTMRRCFSHCAIFPKDYVLRKNELIYLWMAQGCLNATRNEEMEIIAEECFENLALRSLFQDFRRDENGRIISCKMHDIVHDFAQFLTENECFVMEVNDVEEVEEAMLSHVNARHSMLVLARGVSIPASIKNVKQLRSLVIEWKDLLSVDLSEVFDQLTCLRTLDLSAEKIDSLNGPSITELPMEVGKLIHLRYLNLAYNRKLKELPETVCDLCNLQSLNVSNCYELEKLPHGLGKLINLRHLEIYTEFGGLSFMPKGVERLTYLRTLDTFYLSSGVNDSEASTLEGLKNLNHLRGKLTIKRLRNVRDVDEVKKAQLKNKKHLIGLGLNFSAEEAEGRTINDEQVIEAIQPPPNLEQLAIQTYQGSVFPNWIMSLTNLKELIISHCRNCELLPPLGELPSLESIEIKFMPRVKSVGIEFLEGPSKKCEANTSSSSVIAFPRLEVLCFQGLRNWKEWDYGMRRRMGEEEEEDITTATTNILIMPLLHTLKIGSCPRLKALPGHLLHKCPSLKELKIYECPILEERYYKERKGEDWSKISHIPNIFVHGYYVQREATKAT